MVLDGDWENLCLGLPNTHQTLRGKGQPNVNSLYLYTVNYKNRGTGKQQRAVTILFF
jgi:hypothetical protein